MTLLADQRIDRDDPPKPGDASPWGAVTDAARIDDDITAVVARMGAGLWLAPEARLRMPFTLQSSHGPAWWSSGASAYAMRLALDKRDLIEDPDKAVRLIFCEHPGWLDVIAEQAGLPNLAQAQRILALWERFDVEGCPDFTAFAREHDTGMVHGWIGKTLFVGIEPNGRAHS